MVFRAVLTERLQWGRDFTFWAECEGKALEHVAEGACLRGQKKRGSSNVRGFREVGSGLGKQYLSIMADPQRNLSDGTRLRERQDRARVHLLPCA